ncbi:MAG: GDP-mannose 4,6-dehydratase [Syntrophomonadaceae bacterium]|nr:GDP-mannose 4,6-dehydratase [Bacillota bacterium]
MLADASKAKKKLGWEPKITFRELAKIMVDADMDLIGLSSIGEGKKLLREKGFNWTANKLSIGG